MRDIRARVLQCSKTPREQGLIYYTCLNYDRMPEETQQKIDRLCKEAGKHNADALKDLLLHGDIYSCERIAGRHYCSANTLLTARRRFYELW